MPSIPSPFDQDLGRNSANFVPLTPISHLRRTARVYPDRIAVIYGEQQTTWSEFAARCDRLAAALTGVGIGRGDTVAVMAPNVPVALEAHFGVPMAGAVLNMLNIRLDSEAIAFQLEHGGAKLLIVDPEFNGVIAGAIAKLAAPPMIVEAADSAVSAGPFGGLDYEAFLAGAPDLQPPPLRDEWDAIALNYTSGTTGDPKGVVYHHRGAYLNAAGNVLAWPMRPHPVLLWTLPMFHCNGWCFPWTMALVAGASVCLRKVEARTVFALIERHDVEYLCGAPAVMNLLANAAAGDKRPLARAVQVMTAGSAPPPSVIGALERDGFQVSHVYGLTEVYGPSTVCAWHDAWDDAPQETQLRLKARQGVVYPTQDDFLVANPTTLVAVPKDGLTMGEVFLRGNTVMKGYLKNPRATEEAFQGGWFHTGDLGVWHPDGYLELKDRSKDIIISGGENISTIEVEEVLYEHPAVLEAAVVQRPDERWGETPCAFVALKDGATTTEADLIAHCRARLAGFKTPKSVVFGELPKTSTGKIQKYLLRERAAALGPAAAGASPVPGA